LAKVEKNSSRQSTLDASKIMMFLSGEKVKFLTGALFILMGVGLVVLAIKLGIAKRQFLRDASTADGLVVRLNAGGSHPQIEFTTTSGQSVSYPQGGLIFGNRIGDRVRVLYNSGDPIKTACVDSFGALWFAPIFLLALGILCVVLGLLSAKGAAAPHLN
jgi:hypothetical protein